MKEAIKLIDSSIKEQDNLLVAYRFAARGGAAFGVVALLSLLALGFCLAFFLFGGKGGVLVGDSNWPILLAWILSGIFTVATLISFAFYRFGVPGVQRGESARAGWVNLKIILSIKDRKIQSSLLEGYRRGIYPGCDPGIPQATGDTPSITAPVTEAALVKSFDMLRSEISARK